MQQIKPGPCLPQHNVHCYDLTPLLRFPVFHAPPWCWPCMGGAGAGLGTGGAEQLLRALFGFPLPLLRTGLHLLGVLTGLPPLLCTGLLESWG